MFSYRHAFHAGNHADVLKHAVLVHLLQYMSRKEAALYVVDTHAGSGWYRLDSDYAQKSAESKDGIARLWKLPEGQIKSSLLSDYVSLIRILNPDGKLIFYPGSPWISHRLLRKQDRLRLFELHPTDQKILTENVAELRAGRQITVQAIDGFDGLKAQLPPPSRRGLVLIDPSYEIKTDYARVAQAIADSLKRFATGTYAVWYPIIALRESQQLPEQLSKLAGAQNKSWLNVSLTVRTASIEQRGLVSSGLFLINPPYTLKAALQEAMPELVEILGQDRGAGFELTSA